MVLAVVTNVVWISFGVAVMVGVAGAFVGAVEIAWIGVEVVGVAVAVAIMGWVEMSTLAAYLISGVATIVAAWVTAHVARIEQRVSELERWRDGHEQRPHGKVKRS